ncbi:peptidoglycan DD-metalloendopeptidase family protein [candidate division KSB1 bacterium]|nr:peptidoglycan DD-metalloendopeptidase family protein [candidate division KSB1 bacterium]
MSSCVCWKTKRMKGRAMNLTELFLQLAAGHVDFLVLQSIYTAIVFAVVWLINIFSARVPYWQIGLWSLVLLRLLLPPGVSFPLSGCSLLQQTGVWTFLTDFGVDTALDGSDTALPVSRFDIEARHSAIPQDSPIRGSWWHLVLFFVWSAGFSAFLFLYIRRLRRIHHLTQAARPVTDSHVLDWIAHLRRRFHLKRTIRVVTSNDLAVPFTLGTLRPVIYVPAALLRQERGSLIRSVLAHEVAHISRFDDIKLKLQGMIQVFYFFHPLVWISNRYLRQARECYCDQLVVYKNLVGPDQYGRHLLDVLKLDSGYEQPVNPLPALGRYGHQIRRRLKNLKGEMQMKRHSMVIATGVLILLGFILLPMSGRTASDAQQEAADQSMKEISSAPEFSCPLKSGRVSDGYGRRLHPIYKKMILHRGIDIAAEKGTPVYAAADGVVDTTVINGAKDGAGKYIIVHHSDGYSTVYTQLDRIDVIKGQTITAGEAIAAVGSSGLSTGPHLHFELRLAGKAIDPETLIRFDDLKP